jgi:hypothetical protein
MSFFEGPCTVNGGLPMWAKCRGGYDSFFGEHWADVDSLHWMTRKGKCGKEVSQAVYERLNKRDPYWESDVLDQVSETAAAARAAAEEDAADAKREERLLGGLDA